MCVKRKECFMVNSISPNYALCYVPYSTSVMPGKDPHSTDSIFDKIKERREKRKVEEFMKNTQRKLEEIEQILREQEENRK